MWAFNARQTACTDAMGLLLACIERALSSPPNASGNGGSGTIAKSALMHLAGTGRVNSANYSTCLHRLARVVALPTHPGGPEYNDCNGGRPEWSRRGPGHCRIRNLCCWCVAAEMACGVDRGMSILEGSDIQKNWATDFGGVVAGVVAMRPGRQRTSLAPLPAVGAVAAPLRPAEADGNGDHPNPSPRPCLHCGRHWQGRQW